ncbi:MAG TPA: tRNA uridine-5-carboxymethylaminomethyl(34) synthesis enzyme MnmG [Bacillota bacterium]|nr:tRNA uridine-5-carboxymethylaminomethyl(34) synthesis enzyme MnmG [Bacillota bacterium]HPE38146.1 tRNA uridine-5-carboxymethylaminomethyl(34) synthesis enzyme MnmG [Bacillota bacterium]
MGTWNDAISAKYAYIADEYEVAVVGAGHAGCEAACAAAHLGLKTVLFTLHLDAIANLPCNPSIGGTAKGQLVREIDALGGIMGEMADLSAIQTRMLNRSKGPAVFSPRAQMDRSQYSRRMKERLEKEPNLTLCQSEIVEVLWNEDASAKSICGVKTKSGACYPVKAVVICSGTYMESRTIMGECITESGPDGLSRSVGLSQSLRDAGIPILRFKTGTPVRVNALTVDKDEMDIQPGEPDMPPFSFGNEMAGVEVKKEQIPCYAVWTTEQTREVIKNNMDRSPLYSGVISGTGPRYCPSIEDKFVRFSDKSRHQIFVEPMGETTEELYLQGFSTSLPEEVQIKMVHSLPGLSHARIQRYAYAIEYDLIDPTSMKLSLESTILSGLFTGGQINGSSGYEEAGAQGLLAGINAALYVKGEAPLILDRSTSYLGVLVDDLVTKGTSEPYRMMTSRAEYRLFLRQDNADIRLTDIGHRIGLVGEERYAKFCEKRAAIEAEEERLRNTYIAPKEELHAILRAHNSTLTPSGVSLAELVKRPELHYDDLAPVDINRPALRKDIVFAIEVDLKYEGYIALEKDRIAKFETLEKRALAADIPYESIEGLRLEARQKLSQRKPLSVGQASRISGVSPADIAVLLVYLDAQKRKGREAHA